MYIWQGFLCLVRTRGHVHTPYFGTKPIFEFSKTGTDAQRFLKMPNAVVVSLLIQLNPRAQNVSRP